VSLTVTLEDVPVYIRAGTVLPLAASVQSTSQLPGGPVTVQVYRGQDGSFSLVEDDGETFEYASGAVRTISFAWTESTRSLQWTASSGPLDPHGATQLVLVSLGPSGRLASSILDIGTSGRFTFPA
jgi:alpha-glucosidase (family GH31 glycosyl hydrolase)